jgi:hypothetical protein
MGDSVYPVFQGRMWDTTMAPNFNTKTQVSVSLSELRASFAATPIYHFKLGYDVLRDGVQHLITYTEMRDLMGFYLARQGRFDSFLYEHPDDHEVVAQVFAIADGVTSNYNLARTLGEFTERVANVNAVAEITVNDVPTSNYTLTSQGVVQFTSPPALDASLGWSGTYYYRCRFTNDYQELNQFMHQLWNAKSVEFDGCLGTKL